MGFWKDLKKQSKATHDKVIQKLRLDTKQGRSVAHVAGATVIPPAYKDIYNVTRKTAKHSKHPRDIPANIIRYGSREAQKEGKVMGTMGNYMVLAGTATGQPELVEVGEGLEDVEKEIDVATAGAEDVADAMDEFIKGDPVAGVVALGRAVKKYGMAAADNLTDGEFSHALRIAEDIMEGDYSSAKKEAAKALLDGALNHFHASHLKGQLEASIGLATKLAGQGQKNSSSAMQGGQPADPASMSDANVGSAGNVLGSEQLPGGAARAEATVPASDPSPRAETVTEARAALEKKVAVNQNLDDKMTMCGEGAVPHLKGTYAQTWSDDAPILDRAQGYYVHGHFDDHKLKTHKRSYSALGVTPVQYQNAGMSIAERMDIPVKVAKVVSMVHENPLKTKLKKKPTVRGYSANFTSKPRHAAQKGDARGETVRYVDALMAMKGTVQKDETDFARDKSMVGFLQTIPEDSVKIDATGPMKSTTRSRMVTRSMRKHEKEMGSVLKTKGV